MTEAITRVAETVRSWSGRVDLSEADRRFAKVVDEFATILAKRPFPNEADIDSLHVLSCRLCRRIEAERCDATPMGACRLGFLRQS